MMRELLSVNAFAFIFLIITTSLVNGKTETGSESKLNPNENNKVVDASEILLSTGNGNEPEKVGADETSSSSPNNNDSDQQFGAAQMEENSEHENKKCSGIACSSPPSDYNCESMNNPSPLLGTVSECCPLWICTRQDGSFFTHFGMTGSKLHPAIKDSLSHGQSHSNSHQEQQQHASVSFVQPSGSQSKLTVSTATFGHPNPLNQGSGAFGMSSVFIDHQQTGIPNPQQMQFQSSGNNQRGQLTKPNLPVMPIPFSIFQFPVHQQTQQQQQANGFGSLFPSWETRGRRNAPMNFAPQQMAQQRPAPGNPVQFYRTLPAQFQPFY